MTISKVHLSERWDRFAGFIDGGRICLTNNAAERALRGFDLGRRSWQFAGSERGAKRAADMAQASSNSNYGLAINRGAPRTLFRSSFKLRFMTTVS